MRSLFLTAGLGLSFALWSCSDNHGLSTGHGGTPGTGGQAVGPGFGGSTASPSTHTTGGAPGTGGVVTPLGTGGHAVQPGTGGAAVVPGTGGSGNPPDAGASDGRIASTGGALGTGGTSVVPGTGGSSLVPGTGGGVAPGTGGRGGAPGTGGATSGRGGSSGARPDAGIAPTAECSAVGGIICSANRWDGCPKGYEPVASGDSHLGCGGALNGWCCQLAPAGFTCSGTCVPGACTSCWMPAQGTCEQGRSCCTDQCN